MLNFFAYFANIVCIITSNYLIEYIFGYNTIAENLLKAENRYSGIPTIRREMKARGLPEPAFENRRNEFVVTLYNGEGISDSTELFHSRGKEENRNQTDQSLQEKRVHESGEEEKRKEEKREGREINKETGKAAGKETALLEYCRKPRSRKEIADFLGINTIFYVTEKYIKPLVEKELLQMTIPDKPKSKLQKYYTL